MALSDDHQPHARKLTSTLLNAGNQADVSAAIRREAAAWLSLYTLAPERRILAHRRHDAPAEFEAMKARRKAELDGRMDALSAHERAFITSRLEQMDEGNLSQLQLLALQLIAGGELAELSDALVSFAFSDILNAGLDSPRSQFAQLICLNTLDWRATRDALLKSASQFTMPHTSSTGQWALVAVLRSTGETVDAQRAKELAAVLTKDRQVFRSSRLLESYFDTDPCDPGSSTPSNAVATSARYASLDVTLLRIGIGQTSEDLCFDDVRAGLARFQPAGAITKTLEFADDVMKRRGLAQRQGMLALLPHAALIDRARADQLIGLATNDPGSKNAASEEQDAWITAQYALTIALAQMSGNEQLDVIARLPGRSLLLSMLQSLRPADASCVEAHLEQVVQGMDVDAQARIMAVIHYSGVPLTARARKHVESLLDSTDKFVRGLAISISARLRDKGFLAKISESGWNAMALDRSEDHYEIWAGSVALVVAVDLGVADPNDAVERIAPQFYASAVRWQTPAGPRAMARIDAMFSKASQLNNVPVIPIVEQPVPEDCQEDPPLSSLADDDRAADARDLFARMNETREEFAARQRQAWDAVDQFAKEVTIANATIILDDFSWHGFEAIVTADPTRAQSWMKHLASLDGRRLSSLHFFGHGLARAMAPFDGVGAAALFRRLAAEEPLIRRVVGRECIPADAIAVWSRANVPEIKPICFERLDKAASDAALAMEVLAASVSRRSQQLEEYIGLKLAAELQSASARALMVAGLSDESIEAAALIEKFANTHGFIGQTWGAARYAYERNIWSRHWYAKMRNAKTPEEFWSAAMLLARVVDARYVLWSDSTSTNPDFEKFLPTVLERISWRIGDWQSKRKRKLFGQDIPDAVFLSQK